MKRILHLYELSAGGCNVIFVIAIDPIPNVPNLYSFLLFSKAGSIERRICTPVQLKLAFDPRDAQFDICLTPKEHSLPPNSHYSLRIWIRRSSGYSSLSSSSIGHQYNPHHPNSSPLNPIYRHRLFTHDEFFIAQFPLDVYATANITNGNVNGSKNLQLHLNATDPTATAPKRNSFSKSPIMPSSPPPVPLKTPSMNLLPTQPTVLAAPEDITDYVHVLSAKVSGVALRYTITITPVQPDVAGSFEYLLSLEYEAGGITRFLIRNLDLRITCPLKTLGFTLYTTFKRQTSTGTIHHLSFWICSPQTPSSFNNRTNGNHAGPSNGAGGEFNGICQRLWRTDSFLITSPVLALPSSSSRGLSPPRAPEGMILAARHLKSPMSVEMPTAAGEPNGGDEDAVVQRRSDGSLRRRGTTNPFKGSNGHHAGEGQGGRYEYESKEAEAAAYQDVDSDGWELPSYAYSQSGHGHSGAFGTEAEPEVPSQTQGEPRYANGNGNGNGNVTRTGGDLYGSVYGSVRGSVYGGVYGSEETTTGSNRYRNMDASLDEMMRRM